MSRLEQFLKNKAIMETRKEKKVNKIIKDLRTGLEFEIENPEYSLVSDFRKGVKDIDAEKIGDGEASEKDINTYLTACSVLISKCVVDPDLNDPQLKKAFDYSIPYEFIMKNFTMPEIDSWATEIVGLARTIKS